MIQKARPRSGPSEDVIVAMAADGLTLRQIADRVGLSHETVRQRLGVRPGPGADGG
jgi:DNA-binding NarL/FixJ family response regulator